MTPEQLDSAWSSLIARANALKNAPEAALQGLYKAFSAWSVALSAGNVTPANMSQWQAAFDAQLAAFAPVEKTFGVSTAAKLALGAAALGGGYWFLFRRPRRSYR